MTQESKQLFKYINNDEVLDYLTQLKEYHIDTYSHSLRVGFYAMKLGNSYNLSTEDMILLIQGALLHDIGKLKTPINILNKDSTLIKEEWEIMEKHPKEGFELLKNFSCDNTKKIVVGHHECKTKSYPRKTSITNTNDRRHNDDNISLLTEIVAAADMFDALKSKRSYKKSIDTKKIKSILEKEYLGDNKHILKILEESTLV